MRRSALLRGRRLRLRGCLLGLRRVRRGLRLGRVRFGRGRFFRGGRLLFWCLFRLLRQRGSSQRQRTAY